MHRDGRDVLLYLPSCKTVHLSCTDLPSSAVDSPPGAGEILGIRGEEEGGGCHILRIRGVVQEQ